MSFDTMLCPPLFDSVDRVQKRAFKIILLDCSYKEALRTLVCPRLDERRSELGAKTLKKI